jgi:peptidyl-tRNA hydrolase
MKLFLVTRRDLNAGLRAAMLCHALREFTEGHEELNRKWYKNSNTLVLLETDSLDSLTVLADQAARQGVPVSRFEEPDLGGALAAIAIGPSGRKLVRSLPLAFA